MSTATKKTVKEIVELDQALDEKFRTMIAKTKGLHKGVIKESFEEAIEDWIQKQKESGKK